MDRNRPQAALPLICLLLMLASLTASAQVLKQPTLGFSAPCISANFNTYNVGFKWDPPLVGSDNQFILELSDANGSFSNPVELKSYSDKNENFNFQFVFSFPTDMYGTGYKVRVRSTSPELTSPESVSFPAYYLTVNQALVINNYVGSINLCDGGEAQIEVTNYPNEPAYRWYKNGALISNETGPTLTTSQQGIYYVELDYGTYCSSTTLSNAVEVNSGQPLGIQINETGPIELYNNDQPYYLSANIDDAGLVYQWFKDGQPVSSAGYYPSFEITSLADASGEWVVAIENPGGCSEVSDSVMVTYKTIEATLAASPDLLLLPESSLTLTVTTNATSPTYIWYQNGSQITGSTASIDITSPGTYFAEVVESNGSTSVTVQTNSLIIETPASFTFKIEVDGSYVACSSGSTQIDLTSITATLNNGSTRELYDRLAAKFQYQWYLNGIAVAGETNETISLDDYLQNGTYYLAGTITGYQPQSNQVDIYLGAAGNVTISETGNLSCDGSTTVTLTSSIQDASYTYEWFYNGNSISGETGHTLEANEEGTYYVKVTADGCASDSNEITLNVSGGAENVTISASGSLSCDGSSTVTLTSDIQDTAYSYEWIYNGTIVSGESGFTLTTNQEGTYFVKVTANGCVTSSNEITLAAESSEELTITETGSLSCDGSTSVTLTASIQDNNYTYKWYQNGNLLSDVSGFSIGTNQAGTYYVTASLNGCSSNSNELTIIEAGAPEITIDNSDYIELIEGTSTTITAIGAEFYNWYNADTMDMLSSSSTITIDAAGNYLVIGNSNGCEASLLVTVVIKETVIIPNTVSPNGDGFNDQWFLPSSLTNNGSVEISIYTETGKTIYRTTNYQNNWPEASQLGTLSANPVYFYTIAKDGQVKHKGTITLIY
ncbi:Ig-like domain-containing protein [Aegicerativicinus sediminis]|uniref:Ig-like domain-containing protein n=1 Tax=Aegicerativicinus sediminis TaxID=2893202 RepID=UPI001E28D1BF|nr:gliding motility-associated C-terminal domain-containing protein [Aegicerativicinus sediminis]